MKRTTLFFNENPMPLVYTRGTIPAKELRLRAALQEIDEVHVIAPPGNYIQTKDITQGELEKKVMVHQTIPWPYYFQGIIHLIYGIYFILKYRPVVLEAESPIISGPAVVLLGKWFKIPTVVELRASYEELIKVHAKVLPYHLKKFLLQLVTEFSYSHATAIVANSKTYQRYLKQRGFDSVEINPGLQNVPLKKPLAYGKRKNLIGYLGRLVEEKGVDDLLTAIAMNKKWLRSHGWQVLIAGEGVKRVEFEKMSKDLGLSKLVTFIGVKKNYEFLEQLKLVVNPCFVKHPLEMVNAEAALMGTPMVCYGEKQIPETVIDGQTGIKVFWRDVDGLGRAVRDLIDDSDRRQQIGLNGLKFARLNYLFETQVNKLGKLYKKLSVIK